MSTAPAEKAPAQYDYAIWSGGKRLFRKSGEFDTQERWDAEQEEWVDSGNFMYDKIVMNPDADMVEVDEQVAMQSFPEAFADSETADALLSEFEKKAAGLKPEDGEVTLSQSRVHSLMSLADQMLDAAERDQP